CPSAATEPPSTRPSRSASRPDCGSPVLLLDLGHLDAEPSPQRLLDDRVQRLPGARQVLQRHPLAGDRPADLLLRSHRSLLSFLLPKAGADLPVLLQYVDPDTGDLCEALPACQKLPAHHGGSPASLLAHHCSSNSSRVHRPLRGSSHHSHSSSEA